MMSPPLLRVPFNVWDQHILKRRVIWTRGDIHALSGLFRACRATRAIVSRIWGPLLRRTNLVREVFADLVYLDPDLVLHNVHPQLDALCIVAKDAPDWFWIHMELWRCWAVFEKCNARNELATEERLLRFAKQEIDNARHLLERRDLELRTHNYGVGRAYAKRGTNNKEWTEQRRADTAKKLARLEAKLGGRQLRVNLAVARGNAVLDEPRAWRRAGGIPVQDVESARKRQRVNE